ncbi:35236_t:CDS:2, partial [Racocetra persica]
MPSTITTVCYITDRQESITNKTLNVVKAAGVLRPKNNASALNLLLIGFYSQDKTQKSTLASFSTEDIILSEVVHLAIDPSNLPIFPTLINMTAIAIELPQVESDNVILT